jgi:hypothetical protein
MTMPPHLACDGCGQLASDQHSAHRLERLQWATRYRPVHIQTLFLAGIAPVKQSSSLYSPNDSFDGEAAHLLSALQIPVEGKSRDSVLSDFQKRGLFLMHILECPVEPALGKGPRPIELLKRQLPAALARIRRSLKPKRVLLISSDLVPVFADLKCANLSVPVLTNGDSPFLLNGQQSGPISEALRRALST